MDFLNLNKKKIRNILLILALNCTKIQINTFINFEPFFRLHLYTFTLGICSHEK